MLVLCLKACDAAQGNGEGEENKRSESVRSRHAEGLVKRPVRDQDRNEFQPHPQSNAGQQ